ncbi:MAG: DUF362 domain-containing protein [Myxococcales bacterium]|nr:DUF362 domain-containing protein [Myxococcales bacterium]
MVDIVSFVRNSDYDLPGLIESLRRSVKLCGFNLADVAGKKVLLKPNLLGAYPPERGITTNPDFVCAAAIVFREAGAIVSIGDSPNGIFDIDTCWERSGLREACKKSGAREIHFESCGSTKVGTLNISKAIFDADFVINLPKFKTHSLTMMTLAVKNLFGCVCGVQKARLHKKHFRHGEFANLIVRIANAVKPALTIIDGITAMDENGPSSGRLLNLSLIAASTNMHLLDERCSRLVGIDPLEVPTLQEAFKLGLWKPDSSCEIVGDDMEEIRRIEFRRPATFKRKIFRFRFFKLLEHLIWSNLSSQPEISDEKCKICMFCVRACPVEAIKIPSGAKKPDIDEKECIQCMCCHEVCPHAAIDLKESLLIRLGRWYHGLTKGAGKSKCDEN